MKTFKIPVVWTMYGYIDVQAKTLDEATDKAMEGPLPRDGEYLDNSFEIDFDGIPEDYAGEDF